MEDNKKQYRREWERHLRVLRRCGISLSADERRRRTQAFCDMFGPVLLEHGFVKARGCYWRIHGEDYVQYVALKNERGTPAIHYIACDSEWGLWRMADAVMMPSDYSPLNWYSTAFCFLNTLQSFVGACNRAETIGYGLFDYVDDFDEGLALEYQRFVSDALPKLNQKSTVEDFACLERTSCSGILACIMTKRYPEALHLVDSLEPLNRNDERIVRLHQERTSDLRKYLVENDEAALQHIVAQCKDALRNDLAKVSKRLSNQVST